MAKLATAKRPAAIMDTLSAPCPLCERCRLHRHHRLQLPRVDLFYFFFIPQLGYDRILVFYFHLITVVAVAAAIGVGVGAAAAAATAALIGLFCLIMIIGFYGSLIMR